MLCSTILNCILADFEKQRTLSFNTNMRNFGDSFGLRGTFPSYFYPFSRGLGLNVED
jgi:hypothetical protein